MTFRIEMQDMRIRDRAYRVVVGNLFGTWQAALYREGQKIAGPREYASEAEAKSITHMYAFRDAGFLNHVCAGDCSPWEPMRLQRGKALAKSA
jgi:hypothetical protein